MTFACTFSQQPTIIFSSNFFLYFFLFKYIFLFMLHSFLFINFKKPIKSPRLEQTNKRPQQKASKCRKCRGKPTQMSTSCAISTATTSPPLLSLASTLASGLRAPNSLRSQSHFHSLLRSHSVFNLMTAFPSVTDNCLVDQH